jgi:hypothetical protein
LTIEHLGLEAAQLLSLTNAGEARSLNKLAEMAAWQVPGCSGANAVVWHEPSYRAEASPRPPLELVSLAATHPDLADLAEVQLEAGSGPLIDAARTREPVACPDTLEETRWPGYAEAALRRSVRCSVHLVRDHAPTVLVLALFGVRPHAVTLDDNPMADTLAAFGGAMLANATVYGEAQLIASQFKDAVASRSVVDQAKGVLMHALGCGADEALRRLRHESQRRHIKVTEVARQVVDAYGREAARPRS